MGEEHVYMATEAQQVILGVLDVLSLWWPYDQVNIWLFSYSFVDVILQPPVWCAISIKVMPVLLRYKEEYDSKFVPRLKKIELLSHSFNL